MTLYVPLVTPFAASDSATASGSDSGGVDLDALAALADGVLADGATGLVALGTTGEPSALSAKERSSVLDVLVEACVSRGAELLIGANSPEELDALGSRPAVTGALTLVPPFLRPGEEGVVAYFSRLAAGSPVPLFVYHVPQRTSQSLSTGAILRLADLPNVVGMKYAPGVLDADTVRLFADLPPEFIVLCGDDGLLSPLLALGAHGSITASAHVETAAYVALLSAWRSGDLATARGLGHRLGRLSVALFAEPNPTVIKGVLYAQGRIPTPSVRLPLLPASKSTVDAALLEVGAVAVR